MFKRVEPPGAIKALVDCFWIVDESDISRKERKIVPDGYPEIIFHFGDLYQIKQDKRWTTQSRLLLAGQATRHLFLRNTGKSIILGIKMQPNALSLMFDMSMIPLTDKVVALQSQHSLKQLFYVLKQSTNPTEGISVMNQLFQRQTRAVDAVTRSPVTKAIQLIMTRKGLVNAQELAEECCLSERQLFNVFKKQTGVSPKIYSRIIRLSSLFQEMESGEAWQEAALDLSFFDHSHFIKDFKAFTGENPSTYPFQENNLANFFLQRKGSGEASKKARF